MKGKIYTVTLNPAWDRTATVDQLVPGGTNLLRELRADAGGKGINVSRVLPILGRDTEALGLLGAGAGDQLLTRLQEERISCDFIRILQDCRTNTKIIDAARGVTTEFNEPGPKVSEKELQALEQRLCRLPQGAVAVFAGSLPPGVPTDWYAHAAALCRAAGVRMILDTSGAPLREGLVGGPALIKPNRGELETLCGTPLQETEQLIAAIRGLLSSEMPFMAVSIGAEGAVFVTAAEAVLAVPPVVRAKSTVGAGDTMTAVLADWLADQPKNSPPPRGEVLVSLASRAVAAATAKVLREGTQPPLPTEIAAIASGVTCRKVG